MSSSTTLDGTIDLGKSNKLIILPNSSCCRRRLLLDSYSIFELDLEEEFDRDEEEEGRTFVLDDDEVGLSGVLPLSNGVELGASAK